MAKTILYRLFGVGKIPAQWRATIESEGIVLIDEGIRGTVTYRDFRSPGRRASWKKSAFSGAIALTRTRLLALQYASPAINYSNKPALRTFAALRLCVRLIS